MDLPQNLQTRTGRTILYYPTISIPDDLWLRQAILYWDEVGSIVPQNHYGRYPVDYPPEVQYLEAEGVFHPFAPDAFIRADWNWARVDQFQQEFIAIVNSDNFQRLLPPKEKRKRLLRKENVGRTLYRIHEDKVAHNAFHFLRGQDLAWRVDGDYEWMLFETRTALLYMALLAQYIADVYHRSVVPGTDRPEYENFIFHMNPQSQGISCLSTRFRNILPIPRADVSVQDILDFKRSRHDELLHFRQLLDESQSQLRGSESVAEANEVVITLQEKIERGVTELKAVMRDFKLPTVLGSLKTLIKPDSPTFWEVAAVTMGHATKVGELPLKYLVPGIVATASIELSVYMVDKRNEHRTTLRNSPFSYLYQAQQEGLV